MMPIDDNLSLPTPIATSAAELGALFNQASQLQSRKRKRRGRPTETVTFKVTCFDGPNVAAVNKINKKMLKEIGYGMSSLFVETSFLTAF